MPSSLNKMMVIGNLGADPEMRYTPSGSPVTEFSLAVNHVYNSGGERKEETEWFRVVAWNQLAETCNQFLSKGRKVFVEGRFRSRKWQGNDGQPRQSNEIIASNVVFIDSRGAGEPSYDEVGEYGTSDALTPEKLP